MVIYGVALLSICTLIGMFAGELLGQLIGVKANVGGVGFAMLLLILISDRLRRDLKLVPMSQRGIEFWSAMYIPIVIAMASTQNVAAAIKGGPAALLAGVVATVACAALIPVLDRWGKPKPAATDNSASLSTTIIASGER